MTILYDGARKAYALKQLDWVNDNVSAQFIAGVYYTAVAGHEFLSSVPAQARVGSPAALTGKSISTTGGHIASPTYFPVVSGADTVTAILLYYVGGSDASSRLLLHLDTLNMFPFTPTGVPVYVNWNATSAGIFRL